MLWILGFGYEAVVDAWQDTRLASAIERLWTAAGRPATAMAWWSPSADEYAFRWYLNDATARLLDDAKVSWRNFVIGRVDVPPENAYAFMKPIGPLGS
jgi:hypothetical protein